MSRTEKILLWVTLAFFVGFCLLLPRPERHIRTVETVFVTPAPTASSAVAERSGIVSSGGLVIRTDDISVDINTADAGELAALPGIGPVLSECIVQYREAHGPFASPEDLLEVEGIGPGILSKLFPDPAVSGGE